MPDLYVGTFGGHPYGSKANQFFRNRGGRFRLDTQPSLGVLGRANGAVYHVGHVELFAEIERLAGRYPNKALAGNAYHGVGIPNCVHSGEQAAERLAGRASGIGADQKWRTKKCKAAYNGAC